MIHELTSSYIPEVQNNREKKACCLHNQHPKIICEQILDTKLNLETSYGGANLHLQIDTNGEAVLLVNGIARDKSAGNSTLLLSSTVQTDYEWHELIEGKVSYSQKEISATLFANKKKLAHNTFPVGD